MVLFLLLNDFTLDLPYYVYSDIKLEERVESGKTTYRELLNRNYLLELCEKYNIECVYIQGRLPIEIERCLKENNIKYKSLVKTFMAEVLKEAA